MARKWHLLLAGRQTVLSNLGWFLLAVLCTILVSVLSPIGWATTPPDALQPGIQLYQTGRFTEAIDRLQQVVNNAAGEPLQQAQALNYLALSYEKVGKLSQANETIQQSLNRLQSLNSQDAKVAPVLAQALTTSGQIHLALGNAAAALNAAQSASTLYRQIGNNAGVIGSTLNRAQALQELGLYQQAQQALAAIQPLVVAQPDAPLKVTALRSYGNAQRLIGELQSAQDTLKLKALPIARQLNQPQVIAETLIALGNTLQTMAEESLSVATTPRSTYLAQQLAQQAIGYYQEAGELARSPVTQMQAQLNQFNLWLGQGEWKQARQLLPTLSANLERLPPSRSSIYARVNLAESLTRLREQPDEAESEIGVAQLPSATATRGTSEEQEAPDAGDAIEWVMAAQQLGFPTWEQVAQLLSTAAQQARQIGDIRAESYALGSLGGLYEQTEQYAEAQKLTRQALSLAESIKAPDISYRWFWQSGRLFEAQNQRSQALVAYRQAIQILRSLRQDLAAVSSEVQFSFRDNVEPIYREYVSLLVGTEQTQTKSEELEEARTAIESLQLAELDNFLRQACLEGEAVAIDGVDREAAVIYPIILPDRLVTIVSLPNQPLQRAEKRVSRAELERVIDELRYALGSNKDFEDLAQAVYGWLIQPIQATLTQSGVKTLVFVLDGGLRNIPMAALRDGQQFLIEQYRIVVTPGLRLVDVKPLRRQNFSVLIGALSEKPQKQWEFAALPNVETEVKFIQSLIPNTQVLINQTFTKAKMEAAIKAYTGPIVHLATHGKFSSNRENTFLLTSDDVIRINELGQLLRNQRRNPIELLIMSACQTAEGDNRATLGLAGMAIQAGARSTIGSLWPVSDAATARLMQQFYRELTNPTVTKAEALRRAQLSLIRDGEDHQHPFYWAPFVLVGNWL